MRRPAAIGFLRTEYFHQRPRRASTSPTTSCISFWRDCPTPRKGTRGISLFLVLEVLPDGSRNDVRRSSLEHKLGIDASPTCTMIYGDGGGARGWLLGEENCGPAPHVHDDEQRAPVGRAAGRRHRRTRLPGRGRSPPANRSPRCCARPATATAWCRSSSTPTCGACWPTSARPTTPHARSLTRPAAPRSTARSDAKASAEREAASERAAVPTPVAKAFATHIAIEVASLGIQV